MRTSYDDNVHVGVFYAIIFTYLRFSTKPLYAEKRIAEQLASIPASITAREDTALKNLPLLQSSIEAAGYARPMPPQVEMRAAWDGMRIMIQRALAGTETVDEAVKTGQKAAGEALSALRDPRQTPSK
jgi:maltose-binding protein MalE